MTMHRIWLFYCMAAVSYATFPFWKERAYQNHQWQIDTRRWFHQHAELGFKEFNTSKRIQTELTRMGVSFTTGWGKRLLSDGTVIGGTGVVAEIGSGKRPCIGLRADIDALPIIEKTPVSYQSLDEGVMHACGHDAHTSILLGAVRLLKDHKDKLKGTVRFVFQPAEEGGGGAECMVNEGVLTNDPPVESMFGLHVIPLLPTGTIASRSGPLMAAQQSFDIRIEGSGGGHAAYAHRSNDPIAVAALIIQAFQSIISRTTSVTENDHAGVISITSLQTSQSYNVIPPYADMKGTIRALYTSKMNQLKKQVKTVAQNIASSFGQNATISYKSISYPPTINDPELFAWTTETLKQDLPIHIKPPSMGAEDFSYYAVKVPSNFLFLGIGSGTDPFTNITVHNDHFAVDENALPIGSALLSHLAIERLKTLSKAKDASTTRAEEL